VAGGGAMAAGRMPGSPGALVPAGPWRAVGGGAVAPRGFEAAGVSAGLRASGGRADLALVHCPGGAAAAGTFTQNRVAAAPVEFCRSALARGTPVRALLVNAGQANAATGRQGREDAEASAAALGGLLGASAPGEVLLMSTGVIGQRIKMDALLAGLPGLVGALGRAESDGLDAAEAITTTDLASKSAALELEVGPRTFRVGGMAKGSGMIHPNMATMLGCVTCDAPVERGLWQRIVSEAVADSYNQISVDGDTSTNDSVIGLAGGAEGGDLITDPDSEEARALGRAVTAICQGCAKAIAWDGEGATVLLEVRVSGANFQVAAREAAKAVVSSSLVKSAIFGCDPNWGRIACAAGYSGANFDQEQMDIWLGDFQLMACGQPLPFDAAAASAYLKTEQGRRGTVVVRINLGDGPGEATAWGCDLSYDYVKINAEYTT